MSALKLEKLDRDFTVCKLPENAAPDRKCSFFFMAKTEEEFSLVCPTEETPPDTIAREDGWKAFRVQGQLDFSLTGILAKIAGILAESEIPIFVVSTYNTDYILVKQENFEKAVEVLSSKGYVII